MTPELIVDVGRNALQTVILVGAPMLLTSLIIGLMVSIFQAATQISEVTLTFVPKILAVFIALLLFMPWMMRVIIGFTTNLFMNIPNYIR
ncbi:MAG: flagellar biosynthesis protein FliQ [Nitrospirota bacterium]